MARKWYDDPMLIAAIQFEQEGDDAFRAPAILDKAKFNTEQLLHVFGKAVVGMYEKDRDLKNMERYLSMSNGRNIIIYTNVHCVRKDSYNAHPEWACINEKGEALPAYTDEILICINSSWKQYFFDRVREMLELPVKGIFLDGPCFNDCYCPDCQALFQKEYGKPLREGTRAELREFRIKQVSIFVREVRELVHSINPEIIIYPNITVLCENIAGSDVDILYDDIDFIGSEGGFVFYCNPNEVPIYRTSKTARYIEAKSKGKPYVIFCAGNHQPWARYMLTEGENEVICAATVASGANLWYGIHGAVSDFETKGGQAALNLISKLADNKLYYTDTKSVSDVAVVWPKLSVNAYPESVVETDFTQKEERDASSYGSAIKEFDGTCEILSRKHVTYDIIDEKIVREDDISKYSLVILPNAICFDDLAASKLKAYVENGGKVIATLSSGLCYEDGKPRETGVFNDLFGIKSLELENCNPGHSYIKICDDKIASLIGTNLTAGFAGASARVEFADDVKVIAELHDQMAGRYSYLPKNTMPTIVEKKYGKGSVIYISGGIAATFINFGISEHKTMLREFIDRSIDTSINLEGAYETIEVTVRDSAERTMIHFVNYTGQMRRPIEDIIPCKGIKVSVKLNRDVKRIFSMFDGKEIAFEKNGDIYTFNFDVNGAYDVAVCE